ncbi:hypothetical protein C8R47DRAFT_1007801 [Mycena vitilis]|nr:hypothetical protein C8R47DRAFT_1007801 [Mycena vitilis]
MALSCWKCGASTLPAVDLTPVPDATSVPDLTHLLTSNEIPLESEITSILSAVSDGREQLRAVDTQIADLEATLAQLRQKRVQIAEHIRQHNAIVSPVRRTPPELLGDIFALTLSSHKHPPWYLGHICRFWRLAALTYPHLWNSIALHYSSRPRVTLIETLLQRSSNAPLHVSWNGTSIDQASMDAVLAHCSRWRSLYLDARVADTSDFGWLQPVCGRLTALQTFSLSRPDPNVILPDVFSAAPMFREIYLADWYFPVPSPSVAIPWGQITAYRGAYEASAQRKILMAAPNVMQCSVRFVGAGQPHENTPITLPRLRRLCVERTGSLHHLTTPLLEELFSAYNAQQDLLSLLPFLHRSSCSLTKLVLKHCDITLDLTDVMQNLVHLTYLYLESNTSTPQKQAVFFKAMTVNSTSLDLCPDLVSLVFEFNRNFAYETFFRMARSRFQVPGSGGRLTTLRLFGGSENARPRHITAPIQELCDDGFDAAFLTKGEAALLGPQGFFPW